MSNTPDSNEALKPCPFCGNANVDVSNGYDEDANWVVICRSCKSSGTFCAEKAAAITRWNSRASVAEGDAQKLIIDLQRELAYFYGQHHGKSDHRADVLHCRENECVRMRKLLAAASSPAPAGPVEPPSCAFCDSGLVFNEREIAALSDLYERTGVSTAKILKHALALYQSHIVQGWEIPLESKLAPAPSRPEGEQEG